MLPRSWKPVAIGDLVRLGADGDGSYRVSRKSVTAANALVSLGLCDNWSFEEAFRQASGARVISFDHTVDRSFWIKNVARSVYSARPLRAGRFLSYRRFFSQPGVEHRRVKIGYDGPGETSFASIMRELGTVPTFLKADIEGWEYRILDDVIAHADSLTGIAMELHDLDLHRDRADRFLAALSGRFDIVYLRPNNFGGVDRGGDPIVVEICMARKDLVARVDGDWRREPDDRPNDPTRPDIQLKFE